MQKIIKKKSQEVKEAVDAPVNDDLAFVTRKVSVEKVLSTGSTLLDLAISGKRIRGGGIPGGIVVEIYGPSGSGKSAVLSEIVASCQSKGGDADIKDPEARLDREYVKIYGVHIQDCSYSQPDTVEEIFSAIPTWKPNPTVKGAINVLANDSLAALSSELEMGPKGDKMGQRRAKLFSEGFRKTCRIIAQNNWLMICTNQVRQGDYGETTPGGLALAFYSSLRIRIKQDDNIIKEIELSKESDGKKEKKTNKMKKIIGIESTCFVKKSSIDDPYREVPIYIVFGYGIDDIRGNLQYIKDMTNSTVYKCPDGKTYQSLNAAIGHIEKSDLVDQLKEQTIDLWESIEAKFNLNRPMKRR